MPLGFAPPASVVLPWSGAGIGPGDLGSALVRGATDALMTVGMAGKLGGKRFPRKTRHGYLQGEGAAEGRLEGLCHLREKCPRPHSKLRPIRWSPSICPSPKRPEVRRCPEEGARRIWAAAVPQGAAGPHRVVFQWPAEARARDTKNRHEER